MKNMSLTKLIVLFIILTMFLIFISFAENKETDVFGKVTFVAGNVIIIKMNSTTSSSLKISETILLGDTIETGKEAKVEILLTDNKTKLIILENTKVKLSSLINPEKKKQTIISIFFGSINSLVQKLTGSSTYVIQTPNGSASVRGTEFSVSVTDTLDTSVVVTDGVVSYQKEEEGASYDIYQNQYCITEIDQNPQVSQGEFDNQTWLVDRNNQFEQNSEPKSSIIAANLLNVVKTIGTLIYAIQDFTQNSLIYKLLTRRLTAFDLFQFISQKGTLLQRTYLFYYRLNLYDTIVLGFYRFFDYLSRYNNNFEQQKERCWETHLKLSEFISTVVEIYKVIWFFY